MTPLAMFGLGVPELLIILAVVLLLFGGTRLAGLGKSTGRALKEFKEETKGLKAGETPATGPTGPTSYPAATDPVRPTVEQVPPAGAPYGSTPPPVQPHSGVPFGQTPYDGTGTTGTAGLGGPSAGTSGPGTSGPGAGTSGAHDLRHDV